MPPHSPKQHFIEQHRWSDATSIAIPGDASFRRYERLTHPNGTSAILMDASLEKQAVAPFVDVAEYLRTHKLTAPEILAHNSEEGFALLEDLGNHSFTKVLAGTLPLEDPVSELTLYENAVNALITLHKAPLPDNFPLYDEQKLLTEAALLIEWYFPILNGEPLSQRLQQEYLDIWKQLLPYTQTMQNVVVLRDYHADNLMWLPDNFGYKRVGLLDFQDAVIGSPAYDMVSLLEDARRDVSADTAHATITQYLQAFPHIARKDFLASYCILGAQRNCKIIGVFARKALRDKNSSYLKFLPRVWGHLDKDLSHPLLTPLKVWMDKVVSPHIRKPKQTEPFRRSEPVGV